ncbi:MAG: hypothetical protein GF341_07550, partial [candidate division Zixibacteria bacterium]|nr:hypothetical protein [candidate division Zixibacteria bacterium]
MRMKWYTVTVAVLIAVLVAGAGVSQAQVKIGTVDIQRIRDESPKFEDALSDIDDMVEDFERRRDRQADELDDLSADLQDAEQRGLQGAAERLRNELQAKSQEFQQFMQETFGQGGIIESKSEELLAPLYDKLTVAAEKVAETMELDLILDLEQTNPLFASDALDVTDEVLN